MEYIEVSAKTVSDAITKACIDLGMSSDMLDIQVVSEGNTGFLGFGSKPAVIKVAKKADPEEELAKAEAEAKAAKETAKAAAKAEKKAQKEEKAAVVETEKEEKKTVKNEQKDRKKNNRKKNNAPAKKEAKEEVKKEAPVKKERVVPVKTEEEIEQMKKAANDFLSGTFKAMGIESEITMSYDAEEGCLNAEFTGDDMGVLIGKRGQTLDSLQYLTSLVINKENKDEYIRVKLDTEDYRKRRKDTLENLAKNIANKVRKTGKTVVLEPMNPYERRIIHSALQSNKNVETFSEGNEPYRHVVVKPVRQKNN